MASPTTWFVYKLDSMSLADWRAFGVGGAPISNSRDVHLLARAIFILEKSRFGGDWLYSSHEYWITPCPGHSPFVTIRGGNQFTEGFLISPVRLDYLRCDCDVVHLGNVGPDPQKHTIPLTFDRFHNALRIMRSIDLHELQAVGMFVGAERRTAENADAWRGWGSFCEHPYNYFIKCSDEDAMKIWGIVESRQDKEKT
jgi:hypothetical protein